MKVAPLRLRGRIGLLPHQKEFARWMPRPEVIADGFSEEAILGGWGSAKTIGIIAKALVLAMLNPRHPDYGELVPRVIITGPAERNVLKNLLPKFKQMVPRELVRRTWGRPYPAVELVNGCMVEFTSFDAVIEGDDVAAVVVDEVHLLGGGDTLQNLRNRCRDPLARQRAFIAAGLPEAGWVREHFDLDNYPKSELARRQTMLVGTKQNTKLPKAHLASILASCPSGYEAALVGGGWLPVQNAMYPQFSREWNIVPDDRVRPDVPLEAVGMDVGVSSAAALAQPMRLPGGRRGCLIVGDVVLKHASVEELAIAVRDHPLGRLIQPGATTIALDPTVREDEQRAVRRIFPRHRILIRKRTDPLYLVQPGQRLVKAALRNANKETALFFVESLQRTRHGVVDAMLGTKFSERTGERVKGDTLDHAEDALRYAVNVVLGDKAPPGKLERFL